MKNTMHTGLQAGLKIMLFLFLLLPAFAAQAAIVGDPVAVCPAPSPYKTSQATSSVSFSWAPVSDGASYQAYWVRTDNNQTGSLQTTSNTSITFSGLDSGHYRFYFATNCGTESSSYVIIDDVIVL